MKIKMNGEEIDKWSEKHVGSLALTRTVVGFQLDLDYSKYYLLG